MIPFIPMPQLLRIKTQVKPTVDMRTLAALLLEWFIIIAVIAICIHSQSIALWFVGFVIIATRQHGLLMLYHDAVHGLVAKNAQLNDFIINLLVGIPFLLPVEVFRTLHFKHHRQLGHNQDPERTILFADQYWQYKALPLFKLIGQVIADLFLLNGIKSIIAWKREMQSIRLNRATWATMIVWLVVLAVMINISVSTSIHIILLWAMPALTLTNLLQKIRSFAEHGGATDYTDKTHVWTYSWRVGLLGRLTIWPYNINKHREHHAKPNIPWHRLPEQALNASSDISSGVLLWHLLRRK